MNENVPSASAGWPAHSSLDLNPPRRWRKAKIVMTSVIVLAVVGGCVGYVMSGSTTPNNSPTSLVTGSASPILEATTVASPAVVAGPTAPPPDASTLNGALQIQAAALLRGDEKAWLAEVDPKAHAVITEYERIFHNMRAMHVTRWTQDSPSGYVPPTAKAEPATIDVLYCLLVTSCTSTDADFTVSQAEVRGRALIESFVMPKRDTANYWNPLPWEVSTLSAVVGPQVVVAASSAEAGQLKKALPIAVAAAANANRFARWGTPNVYVAYLADHAESRRNWFGTDTTNDLGQEIALGSTDLEVLIMMPDAVDDSGVGGLTSIVRHEFGHVATLQDDNDNYDDSLVEGLADYISFDGHPSWSTYRLYDARQYVRSGRWSKNVILTKEIRSSNLVTMNAAYYIGYLALRYLAQTYGQEAMLTFWGQVEQYAAKPDAASQTVFHKPWTTVNAAAVAYIKHAVEA